jgi:hypothetical protein
MSLKIAAEHLKSKGRGPDTELIHMTKGEIKGLRQLALAHGTDLTINPETGLPEAGMLMKILPVVAAAAATYFTAGAAAPALEAALLAEGVAAGTAATYGGIMAGAGAGALIGGASASLQGGDVGRGALFGGIGGALSGGMGAYDASPVAGGLGGEKIIAEGLQAGAPTTIPNPDVNAGLAGTTQTIPNPLNPPLPPPTAAGITAAAPGMSEAARIEALNNLAQGQGVFAEGSAALPGQTPNLTPPQYSTAELAKYAKPDSYYAGLGDSMTDTAKKAAIFAAPGIGAQYGAEGQYSSGQVPTGDSSSTLAYLSPNFRAAGPAQPNPYYTAQYPDYKKNPYRMAGGGAVAFANRGIVDLPRNSGADVGTYSDTDPNTANLDAYSRALYTMKKRAGKAGMGKNAITLPEIKQLGDIEEAAGGGLMHGIGGYSDGGRMLKGPGDGMSDSIPATIGSKQPARLADGEFVVPADVVSHLGNGSTDAGAKRLYGMMDKIRKARTGKKKQAPAVKVNKFLPA